MKPTEAQIKEFWEWCGLIKNRKGNSYYDPSIANTEPRCAIIGDGIDLNNLFKYAIPKLGENGFGFCLSDSCSKPPYHGDVYRYGDDGETLFRHITNEDPGLALFWAIWEAINEQLD